MFRRYDLEEEERMTRTFATRIVAVALLALGIAAGSALPATATNGPDGTAGSWSVPAHVKADGTAGAWGVAHHSNGA
jgi:hypothetical protein